MIKLLHKTLAAGFVVILLTMFIAVPAFAFDARTGDTVTVPRGETVDGDIYLIGKDIFIDGAINGDVFAAGQTITVNGIINGGVTLAGQTIMLRSSVANGARLAGQNIYIDGTIGRDAVVAGSSISVAGTAQIARDLVFGVGTSVVMGKVNGNIKGGGNEVTLTGTTGGNVQVEAQTLTVTSTAAIQGDFTYTSAAEAVIQQGAQIKGTTTHKLPAPEKRRAGPFAGITGKILGFLMILVMGIIIIFASRGGIKRLPDALRACIWPSLGWGAAILFATPIAAIIVMVTIVGLPAGIMALVAWGIAIYLAEIPVALLIGRLILRREKDANSKKWMVAALALGLVILLLVKLIPYVGWLIWLFVTMFGLGTLVSACRRCGAGASNTV